ncbi:homoserine kinase [Candidatus Pelagibacter sp.]|nr:homoserine kinase [Candidatus Pelagibacter sp.]
MAVYTKINKKDVFLITKKFGLEKIINYRGIKNGIENTNYLFKTKNKKYILTIFEKRVHKRDIPFFMKLMDKLNKKKIKCPKPLKNINGNYCIQIKNKPACVVTFVKGKDKKNLSIKNCYEVGKNIAKLHIASKKIKLSRKNSMSVNSWPKLLNKIHNKYKNIMNKNLKEITKKWPKNLPSGIIHGDLFIDNIFFKKNKFYGYIDFYFSSNDFLMYEIAICINSLCFDKNNKKFFFNKKKSTNLLKGYMSLVKFSKKEKNSLNILCRGAAFRYLLTRTYDYLNTPKNAIIKKKDPNEYIQKLQIHNNFSNFRDYYN